MYKFRREDTGEIIEVDFETMMEQDAGGFIEIEVDGQKVTARRFRDDEKKPLSRPIMLAGAPPIVSDSLGVCDFQVEEFREDARKHGFSAVEFVKDPDFEFTGFYQAKCTCPEQWKRYEEHRNYPNKSQKNGSGVAVTEDTLRSAKKLITSVYDSPR